MNRHLTLSKALTAVLLFMGIAFGQSAFAESAWTINSSYNNITKKTTFTIKRSEYTYPQTVLYRTVGLSAYAGKHYAAVSGELNFAANDSIKEIEVTENYNLTDNAYKFQNGSTRTYLFEVTDKGGFLLATKQRDMTTGTSVNNSSTTVFGEKELTIKSEQFTVTDDGYDQAYHSVNVNNYYSNSAPKNYFTAIGAQLRMTVTFDAREKDDGYQYIAIYANTDISNVDTGDKNGDPGTINYSKYMAGFTIEGNVCTDFYPYTFPVTSKGNACGYVEHPWSGNPKGNLEQQYFNTDCRATDGRLIIPTDLSSLYVRFDASGNLDDDWYAKNVKAHIQAIDNSAPTMKGIVVNPGRHARGNTVYVSVAFSEIMTVTGTPTLSVYWGNTSGTLDYTSGSGSNVLTFKGIIPETVSGMISITGYDGTIQDLAGNNFSGSISSIDLFSIDADLVYTLSNFQQDSGKYLITCHDDLRGLAGLVNNGGDTSGKTFRQVTNLTFPYSTQWNTSSSKENNFTSIGNSDHPFQGTYDGEGHTISGIRIYKDGDGAPNNYQGLFGKVSGTVKRVHLTDTRITGKSYVGGIAGETNSATIEECTVANNVCIHAVNTQSLSHGGVVGYNRGTVQSCISHATLTVTKTTNCSAYGGIAGRSSGSITDCLAIGATIPGVDSRGAILGYREGGGSLTCNYYLNCTVAGTANATNVGFDGTDYFNGNSARALYALTLGAYIAIDHDPSATLPGSGNITYDNGADINGQPYSYNTASLNLTYNGNLPTGYHTIYTATAGTINGNTLTMPASAVTVSSNFAVNTYSVRFKSNSSSATGSMANQGFTYGVAQPLNANAFSRTGYTFAGWNTQADGNGTFYTDQQSVSNLTANHGETVNLYAQWEPISYTVHFDANYDNNGIVITGTMSDQNFIYDHAQNLTTNAFEREGYTFTGWNTQADGMGDDYNNGQEVNNLTYVQNGVVTLYAKWDLIYWTGDGSSVNPYLIIYPSQLVKLANDVNSGNNEHPSEYFKLGNDIDMSGVNFEGIGNSYSRYFKGDFNGDNKTISNLTISKPNTSYVGLFSYLNTSVSSLILSGATITGGYHTGAIAGMTGANATISNCLVINSSINSNDSYFGVYAGDNNISATFTHNYYYNCTCNINETTYTINIATNQGDKPGARSIHTLELPERVTATSTDTVTYNQVLYYASNVSVTLSPEIGYAISDVTVNGEAATNNGDGTWSFDMPAAAATVSATVNLKLPGTGEANNPYIISTTAHFDLVATLVNNGESYSGVYFKLADNANITVSNMMGTSEHPFSGNFDGNRINNATLTLNLLFDTEVIYTAPFRYVSGANIHDLFVGGDMRIGNNSQYAASIVAHSEGTTILNNCVSNVEINSEAHNNFAYNGGLVGHVASGSTLNITNCVFKGRVFYHNSGQCCGFVGLNEGTTNINGGIYEPSYQQLYTYYYYNNFINPDMGTYSLTDCYYTQPMGESWQGTIAYTSVIDNLCHQISIAGETVYASPDYTFIDNVNSVYDCTGAAININPTVIFGGETLDPSCYTLSLTYNGNPATEVNAPGNYLYTAAGVNANGYYGNVYRYFSVVGFDGSGTDSDPYLIESIEDWNKLASRVYDGTTYSGKHFKLMANLTISKVVGYNKINSFQGIFDGDGHTLTLNGDDFGTSGYYTSFHVCAPFRYVAGTTIKNLKVAGDIYTKTLFAGGLIGRAGDGNNVIQNCIVSVNIHSSVSGDGTHGGFIAHLQGGNGALSETTFSGCAFTGSITTTDNHTTNVGGFVGWCEWGNGPDNGRCRLFFNDCFINPSASCISEGSKTFARCNNEGESLHFNNGYFTQAIGDEQGQRVENDGALPIGSYTLYNVIGLKFYDNGVKDSDGTFYHNTNALSNAITREITGYGEGSGHWAFIASPIEGSVAPNTVTNLIGTSIPETNPVVYDFDLYRLNPSDLMWENYHANTADFNLVNGQGYLYATKETKTLTFTGTLDMGGEKAIAGLPNGYNLVGNPFCIEAYVNKPYYTLDDNGAIIVANPVDKATAIQPCYGVIVKVENNEDVVFRTTEPFMNSSNGSLEMTLAQTVATRDGNALKTLDNAIISFDEGSKLTKFYFGHQDANIYIPVGHEEYAIAYSEGQGEMPLNFKAHKNGEYTLTVETFHSPLSTLHLIDNLTGANINLLVTPSYTFTAKTTDYASRFKLVFSAQDPEGNDDFAFIDGNGNLIVNGDGIVQIIDVMGRIIFTNVGLSQCGSPTNGMTPGVYVLRLINGENVKMQKIVVR